MESDAELLQRYARDRSEAAFAELVRRHLDLVYSAALRQAAGDSHRAQDISQLVFLELSRRARDLSTHPTLRGWLFTCTHHTAAFALRSERRRKLREQEAHAMQTIDADVIDWDRLRPVLDEAMHELPERDRHAVLMRWFDQKPTTEIATALGLSESAARRLTDRALESLRALLARRGITSTAAALGVVLSTQTVSAAPSGLARSVTGSAVSLSIAPPWFLTLLGASKVPVGLLAVSLAVNLGLITALNLPPRLFAEPPEPAQQPAQAIAPAAAAAASASATPAVEDLTDPLVVGRRLLADGYPEHAVIAGVRGAVAYSLMADVANEALYRPYTSQRTRWRPNVPIPPEVRELDRALGRDADAEADAILQSLLPNYRASTPRKS